jgi:hypothetical protein
VPITGEQVDDRSLDLDNTAAPAGSPISFIDSEDSATFLASNIDFQAKMIYSISLVLLSWTVLSKMVVLVI